jgi:hypothetical protein
MRSDDQQSYATLSAMRRTGWLFTFGFWTALAVFEAVHTWLGMLSHGHSLVRLIVYQLLIWWLWAFLTPLVYAVSRRYPLVPFRVRNLALHVGAALTILIVHATFWAGVMIAIRPFDERTVAHVSVELIMGMAIVRLPLELMLYFGIVMVMHAIDYRTRAVRLEQSLTAAQLHALELQLQPHFLFNTLNSVSSLVRAQRNDQAVEMIAGLSDLLRYTLDHAGEQRVPLEKEAAVLRRYLEIQHARFGDRLEVRIDIAPEAKRAAVPALILQPLAENAIRHGIAQSAAAGRIDVAAYRDDALLRIDMFNSGRLQGDAQRGIGLRNTIERLRQLYPGAERFELRAVPDGVMASIRIPWSEAG